MRRRKPPRVMGPYQERNRWRVVIIERGKRKAVFLPNREEALRLKAEVERDLGRLSSRKLADVMNEWAQEKLRAGCIKPETVEHYGERLGKFFSLSLEVLSEVRTPVSERDN